MSNHLVMNRLQALLDFFAALESGGQTLSSSMKGLERELFIQYALSQIIAPPFRIGRGKRDAAARDRPDHGQNAQRFFGL